MKRPNFNDDNGEDYEKRRRKRGRMFSLKGIFFFVALHAHLLGAAQFELNVAGNRTKLIKRHRASIEKIHEQLGFYYFR